MRHIRKAAAWLFRDRRGAAYIETLVKVFVIMILACFFLNLLSVGVDYTKLVVYANSQADSAATSGAIPGNTAGAIQNAGLKAERLDTRWDAQYFDTATSRLAFRQPFHLTVTYTSKLPMFFSDSKTLNVTIPLQYVASSTSGVYWK